MADHFISERLTHGRGYCFQRLAKHCEPRERLTVSQWADRYRWLSSKQSGERGRWKTDRNPILREIMDCLSVHSPVREVVVMKASQIGMTEATVNWLGYIIDHAPSPAMVLMPTLESRDKWKAQKLNPLLTETDQIAAIIGKLKSRSATNRQDIIDFPGGILFLAGGNSPNSYAQSSARCLIMDDLDRFPTEVGEEGDPVALARGRLKAFSRSKLLLISTPTLRWDQETGGSLIEREYLSSDRRRYFVHCPHCGEAQPLIWDNLKYDHEHVMPTWAEYECASCGKGIRENAKPRMLAEGEWRPADGRAGVKKRGYALSTLYAPIGLGPSWLDLVQEWRSAQGDPGLLKTFINTNRGETWEDNTTSLKPHELAKRAEAIEPRVIPIDCLAITIGIDVQDEWIAIAMLGWGEHHLWVLEYTELQGDTTRQGIWDDLEDYLHTWPRNAYGKTMRFAAAAIDSRGHRTEEVRQFVSRQSLQIRVFAIQGSTSRLGRPIATAPSHPDKNKKGRVMKGGYGVWNVGTEHCKDFFLGRLAADLGHAPQDRYVRFCQDLPEEYYNGLLSEYKDPRTGRYVQRKGAKWKRNEPLDTINYAWAVGHHRQINIGRTRTGKIDPHYFDRLAAILQPPGAEPVDPETIAKADKPTARRDQPAAPQKRRIRSRGVRR